MRTPALVLGMVIMSMTAEGALPDPYAEREGPWIGPAPVPVMEQVFWVQLPVPPTRPVKVQAPEGVTLLDRTRPGPGHRFTRVYFRADRGIRDGVIRFTPPDGAAVSVPLTVRTYREDVEAQLSRVAGIDPTVRKTGRSYFTDAMVGTARRNLERYPELASSVRGSTPFDAMDDEELWRALPSWNVPRQCYSNWPCPHCGAAIFSKSGFYPWRRSATHPFKCVCPLCGTLFPTNDWRADDFTSGEYPDDGWGYDPGTGERADFHGWVAHYTHHVAWHGSAGKIRTLGLRYLMDADESAAHRAALLLVRMAYVYPGMNMRWQQVRSRYLRPGRLLIDGNWERNDVLIPALQTYDAIFDWIARDSALVAFVRTKDPTVSGAADIHRLLDTCLVQLLGADWLNRELSGGNQGAREEDLAQYVSCAGMGPVGDRWLEELFTHAYNSGMNRGGFDDETLVNTLSREGLTLVAGLGYAMGYTRSKSDMAEILSRLSSERWAGRCNLYDPALYPKVRAEYDAWIDMLAAGQFGPSYGDSGGGRAARYPRGLPASLVVPYSRAYRRWPTDRIARALYRAGRCPPLLFEPDVWPDVEAHVKRVGPGPSLQSRVLDGAGFVFLESRSQAEKLEQRAAIALRYGYAVGHHHQDNLNIEMWAHGQVVSPELGYPCWAHPMGNTSFVAHHNTGMIDRAAQYAGGTAKGTLELFSPAPEASFADVSAAPSGFPNRVYRRAVCLADAPDGNVYLLDVLRLAGGTTRTYCFHGPGHKDFDSNLELGPVAEGAWDVGRVGRGLKVNIVDPQLAQCDGNVWAQWACDDSPMQVRLRLLGRSGRRYVTARCAKTDIPPIRYLFAEDEAADGASEFVGLWEPHLGDPFVLGAEPLTVRGAPAGEFAPVAVRVRLRGEQTDTFIYSFDPESELEVDGIRFQGRFGYWSEQEGRPRCLHLVNGRVLAKGGTGVTSGTSFIAGAVRSVDLTRNRVELDQALPADALLTGRLVSFRHGSHRSAYRVAAVHSGGTVVELEHDPIIFRSRIVAVAEDRSHLVCELTPRIPGCGGVRPYGYYDGALLTDETRGTRYRVVRTEGAKVFVEPRVAPSDFADADGDGRQMALIYDLGPGDSFSVASSVYADFVSGTVLGTADVALPGE